MNRRQLATNLADTFDGSRKQCRTVARAAGDLADAGMYRSDVGVALTPSLLVDELTDAPEEYNVVQRWNWWIGSLELAYGGYDQFRVRRWEDT